MPKGVYVRTEAMKEQCRKNIAKAVPVSGRVATEATREKMRAAKLLRPTRYWLGKKRGAHSEATKAKMSQAAEGRSVSPEIRAMAHAARRGSTHSVETRKKIRTALARPEVKAKIVASVLGKPCRHAKRTFFYKGQRFKSSYEVRVAAAMDALGIVWQYEPTRFDCAAWTYAPDFFLPAEQVYWEVKGWFGPDSQRKVSDFRQRYPDVPLVVFDRTCMESLEAAAHVATLTTKEHG